MKSTGGSRRSQRRIYSPLFSYVELNKGLLIPWLQVRVLRGSLPVVPLQLVRFRLRGTRVTGPLAVCGQGGPVITLLLSLYLVSTSFFE